MPTTIERIRTKLTRADQHINDFELRSAAFFKDNPYMVAPYEDAKSGQRTYIVVAIPPIPDTLASIAADALQNIRSPLDQLATQIETAACGTEPKHRVYFPIGRDATHYETVRRAYIKCSGQAAIDAFDATEPYKGGRGHALWQLNQLNTPDKHVLPLAVSPGYAAFDISSYMRDAMRADMPDWARNIPVPSLFLEPKVRRVLKVGHMLFREPMETPMHEGRKFAFHVSFNQPGVIECQPVLKTLKEFANLVGGILNTFEPFLP